MREYIEDALNHRDDGYGRAQKHVRQELPKRFYENASIAPVEGGYAVLLDGRPTKTPGNKTPVIVPTGPLALAIAEEWAMQGERLDPHKMPIIRLVNSAIESGEGLVPEFQAEVVRFASSDLLLYRADAPRELVADQERLWDDALVRIARRFGVSFQPTIGIVFQEQPPAMLEKLRQVIAPEPLLPATALVTITSLTGSGLLALALRHGLVTADEAWTMAHVDEDHQAKLWGVDEEAANRRARRRTEYDAALRVLALLDEAKPN